jgi:DICT domain-containing protein
MTYQRSADTYLERARELEDYVLRVEQNPPSIRLSPRWRDTAFLRREAARWRAYAQALPKQHD